METLQVSKYFVMEAYNAACPSWKTKILAEFPLLIPQMLQKEIRSMNSYEVFCGKSLGEPISFVDGCIEVSITRSSTECTLSAYEFVKQFIVKHPDYKILMSDKKITLTNR